MSATTSERRESTGIVGDALRRPIQEAVKEGVREAMREQEQSQQGRSGRRSDSGEEGGGGRGKFAMLALLGIGVAAFMLWRRRSGDSGGGMTESIREQSKSSESGSSTSTGTSGTGTTTDEFGSGEAGTSEGGVEVAEESDEAEDAPEASTE